MNIRNVLFTLAFCLASTAAFGQSQDATSVPTTSDNNATPQDTAVASDPNAATDTNAANQDTTAVTDTSSASQDSAATAPAPETAAPPAKTKKVASVHHKHQCKKGDSLVKGKCEPKKVS